MIVYTPESGDIMADRCKHFDQGSGWFSSDYCNISGKRETIPSSYNYYCKNGGYKCPWYEKEYGASGGCFITTVTCNLLGKDDHDPVMDGLRKFRDEILQKQDKYSDILKMYDSIGPRICCQINHDNKKLENAEVLYSKLERFVELINNSEYEKAAASYVVMTLRLVSKYGMQKEYRDIRDNNFGYNEGEFDQKVAGHGKKVTKTLD